MKREDAKKLLLTLEELATSQAPNRDRIAFDLIESQANYHEKYIYTKIYFFYEKIYNEGIKQ